MDKSKTDLIKSKSSNGTSAVKRTRKDKKSRSNAEIKPYTLKKRSLYVEKKPSELSLNGTSDNIPIKTKCTPRPGRKRFLTSIMSLLPKNATETNVYDQNFTSNCDKTNSSETKKRKQDESEEELTTKRHIRHKRKFDDFQNEFDDFVVQQCGKDFCHSPSNYSEGSHDEQKTIKWSDFLPRLVPKTESEIDHEKRMEAEKCTETNLLFDEHNDDKKLYNLFANLLETSFNAYNVSTKTDTKVTEVVSPKRNPETNTASNKTTKEIPKQKPKETVELSDKNKCYIFGDENMKRSVSPISNKKRKIKSKSFDSKKKNPEITTCSFIYQKPATTNKYVLKKDRKKNLLKMLKDQLKIDDTKYMEPQNFFQSLKLMAKSKKLQKSIQFDAPPARDNKMDDIQSILKRHNVVLPTNKTYKKPLFPITMNKIRPYLQNIADSATTNRSHRTNVQNVNINTKKKPTDVDENKYDSRHSLKVFAFDIEKPKEIQVSDPSETKSKNLRSDISNEEVTLYLSDESSEFEASVTSVNDLKRFKS